VDIAGASNRVEAGVSTSHRQRPPDEEGFPDDLDSFWQAVEEHFENLDRQNNAQTVIPVEDLAEFGAWADESDRRFMEEHPPMPEDYGIIEPVPEEPVQATMEPKQNVQASPAANFSGTLFDMDDPAILAKPTTEAASQRNARQEPLITLYDLFGFSEEERSQISRPRRWKKTAKPKKTNRKKNVLSTGAKK
jgi:hypothetical protein